MNTDFNHIESIYWVFTQRCNDFCDHCYNDSGPHGATMTESECMAIIENLPEQLDRLILSGGEPLAEKRLLFAILDQLKKKYDAGTQIMLQTNGDLMNEKILDTLIEKGVTRIDIASIDRFHKFSGQRLEKLKALFTSRGMSDEVAEPLVSKDKFLHPGKLSFGYWGANEEMWLGGNWARGRAMKKNLWLQDPNHNFCSILSGAKGFLGGTELPQEISIQLWKINPCCPGTLFPLGDARKEKIADVLMRISKMKIFQVLNEGAPWKMGEHLGISEESAKEKTNELMNICRYCDYFFEHHVQEETLHEKKGKRKADN